MRSDINKTKYQNFKNDRNENTKENTGIHIERSHT